MSALKQLAATEQALVGAVLMRNELLDDLPIAPEHLTTLHARTALAKAIELRAVGTAFDALVLHGAMGHAPGTLDWLTAAMIAGSPIMAQAYAEQIRDWRRKHELLALLDDTKRKLAEYGLEVALSDAMEGLSTLELGTRASSQNLAVAVSKALRDIESSADKPRGLPTGIRRLTATTGGFRPGVVSVVAARPGIGKSSYGLAIAKACSTAGHGVHVFTLEDSADMYSVRYLASEARVTTDALYSMRISAKQAGELMRVRANWVTAKPLWLLDESDPESPEELVRRVRAERAKNKTGIVIVDYLQIVASSVEGARSEHDAIGRCMHVFQRAAKRDGLAYVVMAQLNRNLESREDKRPTLSDLRGSGTIEERAKLILGLYRGAYYHDKPVEGIDYPTGKIAPSDEEFQEQIKICVLKNSNGATGEVTATWKGEYCEVSD